MRLAFLFAQTLSAEDLRDEQISSLIAKKLREFHELDMPGPKNVSLWQRLRYDFFFLGYNNNRGDHDQKLITPCCRRWLEEARGRCSAEEAKEFRLETLGNEITELEDALSGFDQRVVFCHNDLQYGNIMIYEETRQVTLIVSSSSLFL